MKTDRKKIFLTGLILGGIIAGLKHFMAPAPQDPIFNGRTLTQWLNQLDDGEAGGIGYPPTRRTQAQIEAAEAVHAVGSEALPLLLKDIHATPASDSFRVKFWESVNSCIERVSGSRPSFGSITPEDRRRWRAAQGVAALGPLAKPALPELQRLLFTNYFHSSIKEAAYALATIGPEGLDILTNAVQPQAEWSGMCAVWSLGQHPAAGSNAIPFLIRASCSSSEGTACGALQVLGLLHTDAEHVIPALTNALASTNANLRRDAARALGEFRWQAVSAAPLLQALTNNPATKAEALEAMKKIQLSAPASDKP